METRIAYLNPSNDVVLRMNRKITIEESLRGSNQAVGTHVLMNVYRIPQTKHFLLNHLEEGLPVLHELVRRMRFHVVAETGHQFSPMGYTYAYVLSESHFTIHTYPEYQSCYMDVFCCSPTFQPAELIRTVKELFDTEYVQYQVIIR